MSRIVSNKQNLKIQLRRLSGGILSILEFFLSKFFDLTKKKPPLKLIKNYLFWWKKSVFSVNRRSEEIRQTYKFSLNLTRYNFLKGLCNLWGFFILQKQRGNKTAPYSFPTISCGFKEFIDPIVEAYNIPYDRMEVGCKQGEDS